MVKKNILIVDDSALMRKVLCDTIESIEEFQVAGICKDGVEALKALNEKKFDAMILDVNMPNMDGIQLLEEIRKRKINVTTLMASTLTTEHADITMRCMELGAVDFVTKPESIIEAKGEEYRNRIENMLKAVFLSDEHKKLSKSQSARTATAATSEAPGISASPMSTQRFVHVDRGVRKKPKGNNKLVAFACSTGGPKALQSVIPFINSKIDAPVVLVQHMPKGFTKSMAERLDEISGIKVKEAEEGEILKKGVVYIAPGGNHLEVAPVPGGNHKVAFNGAPPVTGLKPCANIMYKSLSKTNYDEIVCVVLTGMGSDGTEGIVELDKHKPIHVISQDADTSVVYGMPKAIADAGMTDEVLPLTRIAGAITKYVGLA